MPTRDDFLKAVLADPLNAELRAQLADWLDEQGECATAAHLRRPGEWWVGSAYLYWETTLNGKIGESILRLPNGTDWYCKCGNHTVEYWSKAKKRWCCEMCLPKRENPYERGKRTIQRLRRREAFS